MNFEYITNNVPSDGIPDSDFFPFEGCSCSGDCKNDGCSCLIAGVSIAKIDQCSSKSFLHHKDTIFPYIECFDQCNCALLPKPCSNRCIQFGVQCKMKVVNVGKKGLGLIAQEDIKTGTFVVEYVGEVITIDEAVRRSSQRKAGAHNYIFTINEVVKGEVRPTYIDAERKGNLARFINHSCDPNLFPQIVRIGRPSPSIALFAAKDIQAEPLLAYNDHQQKVRQATNDNANITPIPMENLNPRLTEFRRVDTNTDERISFTEFLMGNRPFIEEQSRQFHQLDANSDGFISRKEFETTDESSQDHINGFFRQLGTGLYPGNDDHSHHHHFYHREHDVPPNFFFAHPSNAPFPINNQNIDPSSTNLHQKVDHHVQQEQQQLPPARQRTTFIAQQKTDRK